MASSAAQRTFVNVKIHPSRDSKIDTSRTAALDCARADRVRNDGFSLEGTRHSETGCTPSSPLLPPRLR